MDAVTGREPAPEPPECLSTAGLCRCGSPDIVAVRPGDAAVYVQMQGPGLPISILVRRPTPDTAWCARCWGERYAASVPTVNYSRG